MDQINSRLKLCFSRVFPDLSEDQIPGASVATVPTWDSMAMVTLFSLISEEFGVDLDFENPEDAASFAGIAARLKTALNA